MKQICKRMLNLENNLYSPKIVPNLLLCCMRWRRIKITWRNCDTYLHKNKLLKMDRMLYAHCIRTTTTSGNFWLVIDLTILVSPYKILEFSIYNIYILLLLYFLHQYGQNEFWPHTYIHN